MFSVHMYTTPEKINEGRTGAGGGGGVGLRHGLRMETIKDHGYKNFVFLNHENKQVRCSF